MKTPEEIKKGLECCLDDCDRVGNCPYSGTFGCDECLKRDALAHIEQLESQIPRWIPVEERLPDKMKHVLVFKRRNDHPIYLVPMWHIETDWCGEDGWSKNPYNGYFDVTHWMPLPEPPTKEDKK